MTKKWMFPGILKFFSNIEILTKNLITFELKKIMRSSLWHFKAKNRSFNMYKLEVHGWVATFLPKPWFDKLHFVMIIFSKTNSGLSLPTYSSTIASIKVKHSYYRSAGIRKNPCKFGHVRDGFGNFSISSHFFCIHVFNLGQNH